jgi:chemotaxis family two-component system response regulator Rcp1
MKVMNDVGSLSEPLEILVVDDSPGDVGLVEEAFREWRLTNRLSVVEDGEEALRFLRREDEYAKAPRPDLILLDLNLPKRDGREVLAAIKSDDELRRIPVIILTTSDAEHDVLRAYDLHANCYLTKPVHMDEFLEKVQAIENFWLTIVRLPR